MIQVKENDLQSMDWYKEEDTQSMWLNFLNDSESIIFQICFLDYQYYTVFYCVSLFKKWIWKWMEKNEHWTHPPFFNCKWWIIVFLYWDTTCSFTSEGTSTVGVGGLGMGFSIFWRNLRGLGSNSPFSFSSTIVCEWKLGSRISTNRTFSPFWVQT